MEKSPDFRIRNKSTNPRFNQKPNQLFHKVQTLVPSRISSPGPSDTKFQSESAIESEDLTELKLKIINLKEHDSQQRDVNVI